MFNIINKPLNLFDCIIQIKNRIKIKFKYKIFIWFKFIFLSIIYSNKKMTIKYI